MNHSQKQTTALISGSYIEVEYLAEISHRRFNVSVPITLNKLQLSCQVEC